MVTTDTDQTISGKKVFTGTLQASNLSDGTTTKTMTDVLSGATAVQPADLSAALSEYTKTSELATVATSGSYSDLTNKPTIPTTTGELTNDSGFITDAALTDYLEKDTFKNINWSHVDTRNSAIIHKVNLNLDKNEYKLSLSCDENQDPTSTDISEYAIQVKSKNQSTALNRDGLLFNT